MAGIFIAYGGLVCAFASLRFEWSIPSARDEDEVRSLVTMSFLSSIFVSTALFVLLMVPDRVRPFAFIYSKPIPFAPLIPFFVFCTSATAILTAVHVRSRNMSPVSRSRYWQSGVLLAGNLTSGVANFNALGLILSNILASTISAISLFEKAQISELFGKVSRSTAKAYLSEASASTTVSVVNTTFTSCLPLLLALRYSAQEIGIYFVAMRLINSPAALLSGGISSSFWGEAAELAKSDPTKLRKLYLKTIKTLALFSLPLFSAALAATIVLPHILGKRDWADVGVIAAACMPQVAAGFIFSSTNHLIVYGRQGYQVFSDLIAICASMLAFYFATTMDASFPMTILVMSAASILGYTIRFLLHLKANTEAINVRI